MNPNYVLGIDPSLTACGMAQGGATWTVRYDKHHAGDRRLDAIYQAVHIAAIVSGGLAIIEDLPTHAHGAGLTGMAQGVVRLALIQAGVPYATVPPASLKKYACGKGNATKGDMRMELYKRADLDLKDDNQVDAWWLRQMGLAAVDHPDAIAMPKANRDALLKAKWPEDIARRLLEPYEKAVTP